MDEVVVEQYVLCGQRGERGRDGRVEEVGKRFGDEVITLESAIVNG
jgi:hypothetical protein